MIEKKIDNKLNSFLRSLTNPQINNNLKQKKEEIKSIFLLNIRKIRPFKEIKCIIFMQFQV